jgi:predicted DNA binding CopG/RHH family protein
MKKKENVDLIQAEKVYAENIYRNRAAVNKEAEAVLDARSRQVTIRLSNAQIELAKQQAAAKGMKYQTYIKMLLHEALASHR